MARTNNMYASNEGGNWRVMAVDENGGYTVADMYSDDQEANANQFAAAPDLLDTLQKVIAISDRNHDAWNEAKAAITKALGHTAIESPKGGGGRLVVTEMRYCSFCGSKLEYPSQAPNDKNRVAEKISSIIENSTEVFLRAEKEGPMSTRGGFDSGNPHNR